MIEQIVLQNKTLSQSITLDKISSAFLLDNDKAIDWGEVPASISTYTSVTRIGVGVNNVSISKGRKVSIIGWMINDDQGTIEEKKLQLNKFCNPFDEIQINAGEYKLQGHFEQAVKYTTKNKENNEIICKFLMYLFCDNPLFTLIQPQEASDYKLYQKSFVFPWIWVQPEEIIFGYRDGLSNFSMINDGTVATGFKGYLYISDSISGLKIKNNTTGEEFRLKSTVTLEDGDILYIDTTSGSKTIKVGTSLDQLENAFYAFDLTSDFVQLLPGDNSFSITATSGDPNGLGAEFFVEPLFYALEDQ